MSDRPIVRPIESFRSTLAADLRAYHVPLPERPSLLRLLKHMVSMRIYSPGFSCVFWYRINRWLYLHKWPGANLLNARRYYWFANDISYRAEIGPGLCIAHVSDIVIGARAVIGRDAVIYNGVTIGGKSRDTAGVKPRIGDGVLIYTGAKLVGGIEIGNRVTIGALVFCDRSIPDDSVAYGNPLVVKPKIPREDSAS